MKSRFFTYNDEEGFPYDLDYIEIDPQDKVIFHNKDGSVNYNKNGTYNNYGWNKDGVIEKVNKGVWKEIFNKRTAVTKKKSKAKVKPIKIKSNTIVEFMIMNINGKYDFRGTINKPIRIHIQSDQYNYRSDAIRAAKKVCQKMGCEYKELV